MYFNIQQKNLKICLQLIFIKALYIYTIAVLLPEINLLWSFNKIICYSNIVFEIVPFFIGLIFYINRCYEDNAYSYFLTLFFILFFIPINSGLVLSNNRWDYYLLVNIFCLFLMYLLGRLAEKEQICKMDADYDWEYEYFDFFKNIKLVWIVRIVMILVCISNIVYVYKYNRLNFSALLSDMYSVRADYAEYAKDIQGTTASYLSLIVTKTSGWLLPIYLYFSLIGKKRIDTLICLFTLIANYTVEMQKVSLFIIIVVIYIVAIQKLEKIEKAAEILIKGFLLLFIIVLCEYYIRGESIVFSVFIRRITYVPSYLTSIYYNFFSENAKIWFTQDAFVVQWIVSSIIQRPYSGSAVSVISNACFSGRLASPNTGIFAEAYAQMGIFGIVVFPFIDTYVVKKTKNASEVFGVGAPLIILSKVCFTFLNNFIVTTSTIIGIILFVIISNVINEIATMTKI